MKIQWARDARSAVSLVIGLAPFVPELVDRLGVDTTVGVGATLVATSVAVNRIAHQPAVKAYLKTKLKISYS